MGLFLGFLSCFIGLYFHFCRMASKSSRLLWLGNPWQVEVKVAQLCLTLRNPMDCSPPGSSVHGIFQARILESVVISFSRDLPTPGIKPRSPSIAGCLYCLSHQWSTHRLKVITKCKTFFGSNKQRFKFCYIYMFFMMVKGYLLVLWSY